MDSEERNIKLDDKVTNISEDRIKNNDNKANSNKIIIPTINYKINRLLSFSILNYLAIGISLAMIGCVKRKYFKLDDTKSAFYSKYYLVSGIILYISGIFDWYNGKKLLYLVDFVFSFFFLLLYLLKEKNNIKFFKVIDTSTSNEKIQGTFYIMFFLLFFCIGISYKNSYKNKEKLFIIHYITLSIGFIFLFLHKYFEKDWIEDTYSYIFIIVGGFFWMIGLIKMCDSFKKKHSLIFLSK